MKNSYYIKALRLSFVIAIIGLSASYTRAQISGMKTIPTDYASVAAFVTDLNTQGVGTGGVTLDIPGGYVETAPVGGYTITATGTLSDQIVITSSGTPKPIITANDALVSGSLNDAIFKIVGGDYITLSNLDLRENAANTTVAAATNNMTEWGIALLYATTSDGSQNCTIQDNIITLNRSYQNTFAIYANSTHALATPTTSATAVADGGTSGLRIYGNAITNTNIGILVVGPTGSANHNDGIDIGGLGASTGNTITNFGTTGTFSSFANVSGSVNGILVRNSKNINISYNTISSSVGGVTSGTVRGIFLPSFTNTPTGTYTNTISNNDLSIQSGVISGAILGILLESSTSSTASTIDISSNNFSAFGHTVAGTGAITFINSGASVAELNVSNNTFTNISVNTTGNVTFISHPYGMASGASQTFSGNSIVTGFTKTSAGGLVMFISSNSTSTSGSTSNYLNNIVSNITLTGATTFTGFNNTDGGSGSTKVITGNQFQNITAGTSSMTAMNFSYWSGASSMSNNTINGLFGQGSITGINIGSSSNAASSIDIFGNTISSLLSTGTGGTVIGIGCSNTSILIRLNENTINTLSTTGSSTASGISISGASNTQVFANKIYDISASNASGAVNGLLISSGTSVSAYNNVIGDLRTPNANAANPLNGINITGGTTSRIYFNTVYLSGTSTGALFGSSAISTSTTPNVTLGNNIFINECVPTGAGITAAFRRSSTTLTSFNNASDRNLFYAGVPSASNLIMYDGTNAHQTLIAFQTAVAPREINSITGEAFTYATPGSYFISLTGSSADFMKPVAAIVSQTESGAATISTPSITVDYASVIRGGNAGYLGTGTAPDMGAFEFEGVTPAPVIVLNSVTPPASEQCIAVDRTISVELSTSAGTIVGGNLVYAFDGVAQTAIPLTNTSGSTWTALLPAATPVNAIVSWGIVATNSLAISSSYTGTSYSDEPLLGVTASTSVSNATVCSGDPSDLSAILSMPGTGTSGAGTGTSSSSSVSPFYHGYGGVKTQYIFRASELTAMGLSAGDITSFSLNVTSVGTASLNAFSISMGTTAQNGATTNTAIVGLTPVYTTATQTLVVGTNTFNITPFNWDGTSNIVISFCYTNNNSGGSSSTVTTDPAVSFTSSLAIYADNANEACLLSAVSSGQGCMGLSSNGTSSVRPQFVFSGNTSPAITSVTWMDGVTTVGTGNPLTVNPLVTTTYSATISSSGCVLSPAPTALVNVNPLPSTPTATNSAQCGTQIPTASVTSTSGLPTPTFIWYDQATGGTMQQSDVSTTFLTNLATTTTFYVSELNTVTGCESARVPVTVTVALADEILASSSSASVCIGSSVNLTAANTNATPNQSYTYSWTGVSGSGLITATGATQVVTPTAPGTYQYDLTGVDGGCSAISSVTITVDPFVAAVTPVSITCNGANDGTFTLSSSSCGTTPFEYSVDGGGFGAIPTNLTPGAHTVIVRDANLYTTGTLSLTISEPLPVNVPTTTNVAVCEGSLTAIVTSAVAQTTEQSITLPLDIASQPIEVNSAPGNIVTSVTAPVLPAGAIVTGVTINLNGLIPVGGEYQSDVRLGLSGIFTNAAAQGTGAIGSGTVAGAPFNYTRTFTVTGFPLTGGVLNLLYWDNYSDVAGDDCLFPIGSNVGSIVITYSLPNPATISWWTAPTGGTSVGTGSPLDAVGTSVLPNTNTPGTYTLYAQADNGACSSSTRTAATIVVNGTSSSTTALSNCATFTWTNGTTYNASGTYTQTLTNANGCDSVATLNLTILAPIASTTTISNCASYTWTNGTTYNASGTYTQTLTNTVGCDSIATLDLTILAPTASTTTVSQCAPFTWTNGVTYSASGVFTQTLTNTAGCDSIATLDLTVLTPSASTTTITQCGSYTWTNGTTYSASGVFTQTLVNAAGCDSIATLDLTINNPSVGAESVTACESYTWSATGVTYTASGTQTATLTNAAGCDSIVTLTLTINALPTAVATDNGDATISSSSVTGNQWINCATNSPILGANSQNFAPTANGSYAVIVTNASGCSDTSACVVINNVSVHEYSSVDVNIYPNPTTDKVTVTFNSESAQAELLDAQGKLIRAQAVSSGSTIDLVELTFGVYYVRLTTDNGTSIHKIVKQ